MGRVFSHQWTDKKPFTRRVRWYCLGWRDEDRKKDIRLEFEDTLGVSHRFFGNNYEAAEKEFEEFKDGKVDTIQLQHREKPTWNRQT